MEELAKPVERISSLEIGKITIHDLDFCSAQDDTRPIYPTSLEHQK